MELELGQSFASPEPEVGEVDDTVGGGPFGGLGFWGGRVCRGQGHGLAVGGGGEKECGCDEEMGDTWAHVGAPEACALRIAFCLRFAKGMKDCRMVRFSDCRKSVTLMQ